MQMDYLIQAAGELLGLNRKVARDKFSTLSWAVYCYPFIGWHTHTPTSGVENPAQV
jgi:hypothetical protein